MKGCERRAAARLSSRALATTAAVDFLPLKGDFNSVSVISAILLRNVSHIEPMGSGGGIQHVAILSRLDCPAVVGWMASRAMAFRRTCGRGDAGVTDHI